MPCPPSSPSARRCTIIGRRGTRVARLVRRLAIPKSLRVLEAIQPSNGGFLEATPLTRFVTLALASIGRAEHPVVGKAVDFLAKSVRPDGSWPIDTNLSTWVTTLSVNALAAAGDLEKLDKRSELRDWLLAQQYKERHPYTGADPGGMGVDAVAGRRAGCGRHAGGAAGPGNVAYQSHRNETEDARHRRGLRWLLATCRTATAVGRRSAAVGGSCRSIAAGSDLTAHALRASAAWSRRRSGGEVATDFAKYDLFR